MLRDIRILWSFRRQREVHLGERSIPAVILINTLRMIRVHIPFACRRTCHGHVGVRTDQYWSGVPRCKSRTVGLIVGRICRIRILRVVRVKRVSRTCPSCPSPPRSGQGTGSGAIVGYWRFPRGGAVPIVSNERRARVLRDGGEVAFGRRGWRVWGILLRGRICAWIGQYARVRRCRGRR
jgi:hypothetical protein